MKKPLLALAVCASVLPGEPPTEHRLLAFGTNETDKGEIVLTPECAKQILANRAGRDVMVDLEHQSLEASAKGREDAADARGWGKLEIREDGLWLVGITWTEDGARRLAAKTQRYFSPVVVFDKDTHEALHIFNVALVANPATHDTAPLIAASARLYAYRGVQTRSGYQYQRTSLAAGKRNMDPEQVQKAMAIIAEDPDSPASKMLQEMIAAAAAGGAPASAEPAAAASADPLAAAADPAAEEEEESVDLGAALCSMTGRKSTSEALAALAASFSAVTQLNARQAAMDLNERQTLIGELVKLGAETPALAWEGSPDLRKPCKRLSAEPLEDLRARVEALRAAKPKGRVSVPGAGGSSDVAALSAEEQDAANRIKDPAQRERFINLRISRKK